MNQFEPQYDAVVVGGGLTGLAAAITLAKAGLETLHLSPEVPPDRRTSALMMPSVQFLTDSGLIDTPEALGHALTQIRIIDATNRLLRAPETLFDAQQADIPAFGWNFANIKLTESFKNIAATLENITTSPCTLAALTLSDAFHTLTLSDGTTLCANLIIGADGKKSFVRGAAGFSTREHAFSQSALVCDLALGRPLNGASVEFHYSNGPFTLVPAGANRANLVWIDQDSTLRQALSGGTEALTARLMEKSQRLFGSLEILSSSFIFPLSTLTVNKAGGNGIALIGEAAHAFPPIGAQGLNLGLRDVADLAQIAGSINKSDPNWASRASTDYAQLRHADLVQTGSVVDALFRSLLLEMLPAQALRSGGLWALKLLPALRKQAFAIGMGRR
ncbi:FAD-dependent monooxygenase [Devosia rhodophyticola]|uniref:FAD-dependent monooxygenase n=1 Tax=Devosia rhodophyticola TaxID=3026423 RepID=A0ABY7YX43_9HYPH|nr:FAD-dependent monooxygenase [Devosia rhodophyticola]WDR05742.1 FAD-dependent monooxygenase [Devosia rhodophyticola]